MFVTIGPSEEDYEKLSDECDAALHRVRELEGLLKAFGKTLVGTEKGWKWANPEFAAVLSESMQLAKAEIDLLRSNLEGNEHG